MDGDPESISTTMVYPKVIPPPTEFPLPVDPLSGATSSIPQMEPISVIDLGTRPNMRGIYYLKIDEQVQKEINCIHGEDPASSSKFISKEKILDHIQIHAESSPFFPLHVPLKMSSTDYVWICFDFDVADDFFYVCTEPISEYEMCQFFLNMKKDTVKRLEDLESHQIELEESEEKSFGKHSSSRQTIMIGAFITEDDRKANIILSSVEADELQDGYVHFEPSESDIAKRLTNKFEFPPCSQIQVVPLLRYKQTQTKAYITNNKCIQKDDIFFDKIDIRTNRKVLGMFRKCLSLINKSISEYRRIDLYEGILDQYRQYEKSKNKPRKRFTLLKPLPVADQWIFIRQSFKIIPHYMEFNCISCFAWHPRYIDYVAIAYNGHIHLGKDYFPDNTDMKEYFEKIPQPDYVIVVWKLTKELRPARIITSQFEILSLKYNENYPSLLAGANSHGQIVMWDMNNYYSPEHYFEMKISTLFGDQIVPWKYIPPVITLDVLESDVVFSHEDYISDLQWFPRGCRIDEHEEIDEKIPSEKIITASEDGTIGIWIFHGSQSLPTKLKRHHNRHHPTRFTNRIIELLQGNKCMIPDAKYVVEMIEDEPVPVTALSVYSRHLTVTTGLLKPSYFSYTSMRNELQKQNSNVCSIIIALSNGKIHIIHPESSESKENTDQELTERKDVSKDQKSPKGPHIKKYCFRHEGAIVCLRRCPYAYDVILSLSASSFCIWKEETKDVQPVFWKRNFSDRQYMNGDWSSHKTAAIFLLTLNGIVEIWDLLDQDESPFMTMRVGINCLDHVFPMTFSTKEDQIAFIEQDLLYFAKIPPAWRKPIMPEGDHLQRIGKHELWRRTKYYTWNWNYDVKNVEEVKNKISKFEALVQAERREKLTREFYQAMFKKCVRIKKASKMNSWREYCPFTSNREEIVSKLYEIKKKEMGWIGKDAVPYKVPKEGIRRAEELKIRKAKEIEQRKTVPFCEPPKVTPEIKVTEKLIKELLQEVDTFVIEEKETKFDYLDAYIKAEVSKEKETEYKFDDIDESSGICEFKELESKFDYTIDSSKYEICNIEEFKSQIDESQLNESKLDESSVNKISESKKSEPKIGLVHEFSDYYSWLRFVDMYSKIPKSVLYDYHCNLLSRYNTKFSLECEELFQTKLSKKVSEIEDGLK